MTLAPRVFRFFFRWHHWVLNRWSKAIQALGQYDAAREWLLKAKGAAETQEESTFLWEILATMSEVEKINGNVELANNLHAQARSMVDNIAAHAGEMRDVFLSHPAVARLVGEDQR